MNKEAYVIIGCGYLGHRLKNLLQGHTCYFTRRTATDVDANSDNAHSNLLLDINQPDSWSSLQSLQNEQNIIAYIMVPPSKIDIDGFPLFLQQLDSLPLARRILISSTVVYGQAERDVDADSEVMIDNQRAERQYQIEQLWMQQCEQACVLRLAGIYGPGRIIGKRVINEQQRINGNARAWLNLIHVDDAARLSLCLAGLPQPAAYELGCDGNPLLREDYYACLAELLKRPAPEFETSDMINGRGRRCSNAVTVARTGWRPVYTDIKNNLSEILALQDEK